MEVRFVNVSIFVNHTDTNHTATEAPTTTTTWGNYDSPNNFLSQETKRILFTMSTPMYFFTALFGSVTNMMSMIIFYRQGLKVDSCTPSLWALALSDFCANANIVVTMSIIFRNNLGIITLEEHRYTYLQLGSIAWLLGQPVRAFLEMSSFTMVYLSVDRMVSVAFPFKVKQIFTPKRTYFIIGVIWLYGFFIYLPVFIANKWVWREYENGTVRIIRVASTGLVTIDEGEIMSIIRDGPIRMIRITIVVVCNAIIIYKVRQSKKFKDDKAGTKSKSNELANNDAKDNAKEDKQATAHGQKERKLMRMIVVLSSIYVGCYFPVFIKQVLYYIDTYVGEFGYWFDPYWLVDWVTDYFEFINCSVNVFIYISMSSRYREELHKMCGCGRQIKA